MSEKTWRNLSLQNESLNQKNEEKKLDKKQMTGSTGTAGDLLTKNDTIQPINSRKIEVMDQPLEEIDETSEDAARIDANDPLQNKFDINNIPANNEIEPELSSEEQEEYNQALESLENTDGQGIYEEGLQKKQMLTQNWKENPRHEILKSVGKIDPAVQKIYKKERKNWFKKFFRKKPKNKMNQAA